jgi:carboxymethylenebutenolidase
VLAIYGGADPGIPPAAIAEFDQALARAGVAHESVTYDGAPHSFFDRKQTEFAQDSADAWRRVQAFVRAHTPAA